MSRLFLIAAAGWLFPLAGFSQVSLAPTAERPKDVKIEGVAIEQGAPPGNTQAWAKLVARFRSQPRWADGMTFTYTALLGAGNQYKVLQGAVRYANVKAGTNRAVLYVSPNTLERFGPPLAVIVKAFFRDEQVDEFTFRGTAPVPANWERQFDRISGLLPTVVQTPWVLTDYGSSPDIFVPQ